MVTPTDSAPQGEQQCYLQQVAGDIRTYPAPLPMIAQMQACIAPFGYAGHGSQRPETDSIAQENIGKSANITAASSPNPMVKKRIDKPRQLQRRVSDGDQRAARMDCERDEELLTDHQMQMATDAQQRPAQMQMPPPRPESATADFWSAMRTLMREEDHDIKLAMAGLDHKVNQVATELNQRIDEEAHARMQHAAMVDNFIKTLSERIGNLEIRSSAEPARTSPTPTSGG